MWKERWRQTRLLSARHDAKTTIVSNIEAKKGKKKNSPGSWTEPASFSSQTRRQDKGRQPSLLTGRRRRVPTAEIYRGSNLIKERRKHFFPEGQLSRRLCGVKVGAFSRGGGRRALCCVCPDPQTCFWRQWNSLSINYQSNAFESYVKWQLKIRQI